MKGLPRVTIKVFGTIAIELHIQLNFSECGIVTKNELNW